MIPILDTHQHLVLADRWPYTWTGDIPALAGRRFGVAEYDDARAGTGITHTVFMETTPDTPHWHEEARIACALGDDPTSPVVGAIINCRPEMPAGFEQFLEETAHPRRAGLRRILHVESDELSASAHFRANLRLLARHNLTFDLCFLARQLPLARDLVRACPEVRFVLDHCGVPAIAAGQLDHWRQHLRELADCPNVHCKISGVLAYCAPGASTLEAVRPCVEHAIACFGWDRVVWGGDWPVCTITSSLAKWVEISRALVASENPVNQRKLFFDNAVSLYRLSLPAETKP